MDDLSDLRDPLSLSSSTAPAIGPATPRNSRSGPLGPLEPTSSVHTFKKEMTIETPRARGLSPTKSIIMDTGTVGASPMRIKVTVEAQPVNEERNNRSSSPRRAKMTHPNKISVPLKDADDNRLPADKGKRRKSDAATPAMKKRKPTPARRKAAHAGRSQEATVNDRLSSPTIAKQQSWKPAKPKKSQSAKTGIKNVAPSTGKRTSQMTTEPEMHNQFTDSTVNRPLHDESSSGEETQEELQLVEAPQRTGLKPRPADRVMVFDHLQPIYQRHSSAVEAREQTRGVRLEGAGEMSENNTASKKPDSWSRQTFSPLPPRSHGRHHMATQNSATKAIGRSLSTAAATLPRDSVNYGEDTDQDAEIWKSMILDHGLDPSNKSEDRENESILDSPGIDDEDPGGVTGIVPGEDTMMQSEEFSVVSINSLPSVKEFQSSFIEVSAKHSIPRGVAQVASRSQPSAFDKPVNDALRTSAHATRTADKQSASINDISLSKCTDADGIPSTTQPAPSLSSTMGFPPTHLNARTQTATPAMTPDLARLPTPNLGEQGTQPLPASAVSPNSYQQHLTPQVNMQKSTSPSKWREDKSSIVDEEPPTLPQDYSPASINHPTRPELAQEAADGSYIDLKKQREAEWQEEREQVVRKMREASSDRIISVEDDSSASDDEESIDLKADQGLNIEEATEVQELGLSNRPEAPGLTDTDLWEEEASRASAIRPSRSIYRSRRRDESAPNVSFPSKQAPSSSLIEVKALSVQNYESPAQPSARYRKRSSRTDQEYGKAVNSLPADTPARTKKIASGIDAIFHNVTGQRVGESSHGFKDLGDISASKPKSHSKNAVAYKVCKSATKSASDGAGGSSPINQPTWGSKRPWSSGYSDSDTELSNELPNSRQTGSTRDNSIASDTRQLRGDIRASIEIPDHASDVANKRRRLGSEVASEHENYSDPEQEASDIEYEADVPGQDDHEFSPDLNLDISSAVTNTSSISHSSSSMLRLTPKANKSYRPLFSSTPRAQPARINPRTPRSTPRSILRRVHFSPVPTVQLSGREASPPTPTLFGPLWSILPVYMRPIRIAMYAAPSHPPHRLLRNLPLLPKIEPWTETHYDVLKSLYAHYKAYPSDFAPSHPSNADVLQSVAGPAAQHGPKTPLPRARYVDMEFLNWGYGVRLSAPLIVLAALFERLLRLRDIIHFERVVGRKIVLGQTSPRDYGLTIRWWDVLVRLFSVVAGEMVREDERNGIPIRRTRNKLKWRFKGGEWVAKTKEEMTW